MLTSAPDFTQFDIPEYLYDGIGGNDVNYLLNKTSCLAIRSRRSSGRRILALMICMYGRKLHVFRKEVLYGKQAYVKSRLKYDPAEHG